MDFLRTTKPILNLALLAAAGLLLSVHAEEWAANGHFQHGLGGWKRTQRDKGAQVEFRLAGTKGSRVAELFVPQDQPTTASADYTLSLPEPRPLLCRVRATYRAADVTGRARLVVVFRGGKSAGNDEWFLSPGLTGTTGWQEETMVRAIPPDARQLEVRAQIANGAGRLLLKGLSVQPIDTSDPESPEVKVQLLPEVKLSRPTPLQFAVNAVHHFPGLYEGTLPEGEPGSRRKDFIAALKGAGIRALRFPGGTESHFYLAGYPALSRQLAQRLHKLSGDYGTDWPRGHITKWENLRSTAQEAGLRIIFSLNTSFYVDAAGRIRPVNDSQFTRRASMADGRDHSVEAAAALDRLFENGVFRPGEVDYWEIGNEDFAYMTPDQYADVAAAYARVLARRDAGRPICFTGGPWKKKMARLLQERGALSLFSGETSHYPFSKWPRPKPLIATADYEAFAIEDVGFGKSLNLFQQRTLDDENYARLHRSISETSIYKYFAYDPFRMTCSYARALAFARNWPALLRHPAVDMAVLHDLESVYFGLLMYHVEFTRTTRRFDWLSPSLGGKPRKAKIEKGRRIRFIRQYVPMPAARVFSMLSRFEGTGIVATALKPEGLCAGILAARAQGSSLFFVSNPGPRPVRLLLNWPKPWPAPAAGQRTMLDADSVYPVLENEYRTRNIPAPLPADRVLRAMLPPRSIQLFEWQDRKRE